MFRCGATALFALTANSTGRNLPTQACQAGWRLEQTLTLRLDKKLPNYELIEATLAAIQKHGFYLTHSAIHGFPVAIANAHNKITKTAEEISST